MRADLVHTRHGPSKIPLTTQIPARLRRPSRPLEPALAAMNNEADAQQFDVMCLGNGALSDQRMRHYMLQIQDDASLALESRP